MTTTYKTYIGARSLRNRMISQAARQQVSSIPMANVMAKPTPALPSPLAMDKGSNLRRSHLACTTPLLNLLKNISGGFSRLRLTK